jgi:outer membrane usher protein FimD/PapC
MHANFTKGQDYWSGSGSVSGTVVVADGQTMASGNQSTTFAVVEMGDVSSARINGVETHGNGRAIVPLNSYFSEEMLRVDMGSISNGISVKKPSVKVRPQRGRVMKVSFDIEKTLYLRATLLNLDSKALKFGSSVETSDGRLQYVGINGDVLLPISVASSGPFDTLVLSSPDLECTWRMDSQSSKVKKNGDLINFGALKCEQ